MHSPCVSATLFEFVMLLLAVLVSGSRTAVPTPCTTGTEETTPNKIQTQVSAAVFKHLKFPFPSSTIPYLWMNLLMITRQLPI
jgi:hypothetical protein